MLSYAPIDDDVDEPSPLREERKPTSMKPIPNQECECKYLITFFIFGVIVLSLA